MNGLPKYVVTSTLQAADWSNTQLVSGSDGLVELKELKTTTQGTLSIIGSPTLVRDVDRGGHGRPAPSDGLPPRRRRRYPPLRRSPPTKQPAAHRCAELPNGVLHLTYVSATPDEREGKR